MTNKEDDFTTRFYNSLKEISTVKLRDLPDTFLSLKNLLQQYNQSLKENYNIKQEIWDNGIFSLLLVALKQDFNKQGDNGSGWKKAVELTQLLCNWTLNFESENLIGFNINFNIQVLEICLWLACNVYKRYAIQDKRKDLYIFFLSILDSGILLINNSEKLAIQAIESTWFLQLLISEDEQTTLKAMQILQSINRNRINIFSKINENIKKQILDELAFKLIHAESNKIVSCSAKSLIIISDSCRSVANILGRTYKGLKIFLIKWKTEPFIDDLINILDTGNYQTNEVEKVIKAANKIQAVWKSHITRQKLKKVDKSLKDFQRSYRFRKAKERQEIRNEKIKSELQFNLQMQRKYLIRQLHQRQFNSVQILPANQVDCFLATENDRAAKIIQKAWKKYKGIRGMDEIRKKQIRNKAAVILQRSVRRWLKKINNSKLLFNSSNYFDIGKLDEKRRYELQFKIIERRESYVSGKLNTDEKELLHNQVQVMLKMRLEKSFKNKRRFDNLELLIGQIASDMDLLNTAPPILGLCNLENLSSRYCSYSQPVIMRAKQEHQDMLKLNNLKWWQKLANVKEE